MALGWLWPVLVAGDAAGLCVGGVALGDIHLRFAWQAWHLVTSTFALRGRRGTFGTGLALVARLARFWSPVTPRHFPWQVWHLVTSTFVSRHPPSFRVAGVSLGHIHLRFAWQAWHFWHWAGSGGALGPVLVAGDAGALCVAGAALGDVHLRFAWQAWHLWHSVARLDGLVAGDAAALCVAGVALGDRSHPLSFCVAGVALGHIHLRFAWQAWPLVTSTFVLRGRRGTYGAYGTGLALVARLGWFWSPVTPRHFAWQVWHLVTSTFVSRGRRGTWSHPPSFCVAGVALMALGWVARLGWWRAWAGFGRVTPWHFAWQAWHLVTSTFVSRSFTRHLLHTIFGTQLLHIIFDTQLCHTPPFTYHLSHTMFDTPSFTDHL